MAKNKPANVIIDTNLWISFIISKKYHLLDKLLYAKKVRILFSLELIRPSHRPGQKPITRIAS